jgi:glycosyltransferase A (GT-A) superfamily protein (DUF2064 family)
MTTVLRAVLWLSIGVALLLTFVWPFVVGPAADGVFKVLGMTTFATFFACLAVCVVQRLKGT